MAFLPTDLGGWLGAGSSALSLAQGLFGGKGKSQSDMMEEQVGWNYHQAQYLPGYQVAGLRRAGLNPMLAATKGLPAGQMPTQNAQDDRSISTARQLASAQIASQLAQTELYGAQKDNVEADTLNKLVMPANTAADTRLKAAQMGAQGTLADLQAEMHKTQEYQTKIKLTEHYQRKLEYELAESTLPNRIKQEIIKLTGEALTAKTRGEMDAKYMEAERLLAMGAEALGAVTGGLANSAKALLGNKPKTIIQKAPNITVRR